MNMNCKELIITKVYFSRNVRKVDTENMSVSLKKSVGRNIDPLARDSKLSVRVEVKSSEEGKKAPFESEIEVIAIMEWDEEMSPKAIEEYTVEKGMPYVMSFVRTKLFELSSEAGLNPFIIEEYNWD